MHHAPTNCRTIKELRERLEAGERLVFDDPSEIVLPRLIVSTEMKPGDYVIVTDHPKRSYVARVLRLMNRWSVA